MLELEKVLNIENEQTNNNNKKIYELSASKITLRKKTKKLGKIPVRTFMKNKKKVGVKCFQRFLDVLF